MLTPASNNSFKPNLLRYTNNVAGTACHVVGYATQVGLTQVLYGREMTLRIRVNDVDYAPDELYEQTPFEATVLRELPGPDGSDYWLAQLASPLRWLKEGSTVHVTHIILAARWVGGAIGPSMSHTPVNIAYVVDPEVLSDATLEFDKCAYVAIGTADAVTAV